ncbi:CAAX protease [Phormidium tenue]|uniref:CAAX protease n=1 Tax=Phormidium tenue NIES-30 TaxID=549789 RepID=A0A1U7J2K2_9CYAN|nr:CAAX protease [Phormidium tenue]MBD2231738.1 CAAX protease [Phormidium tenue FACHB-1052]OKH46314.1 CAAX protease [Phormidium tenue NIES-30]
MADPAFNTLWQLVGGVLKLNPEAFQVFNQMPDSVVLGLVFVAGFSQAVGQGIVLFVNRVKPLRFVLSMVLSALLFVAGYLFWVLSIWVVSRWLLDQPISWRVVQGSLALSYLPLMFSFLGAMPYLGMPLLRLLALLSLLAVVFALAALGQISVGQAAEHVALGWLGLVVVQQTTVGQPIVNLGRWLANWAAGVQLVVDRGQLKLLIAANPLGPELPEATPAHIGANPLPGALLKPRSRRLTLLWIYGSLGLLALVVALSLEPLRGLMTQWYGQSRPARWFADLIWIGAIALVVGAMLAPLEALGWWAGWYSDDGASAQPSQTPQTDRTPAKLPRRYIVYLDGINQSTADYQPTVARYLDELDHSLPADITLVKGLISYSVLNRSLTENRPLAFFWRGVETLTRRLGPWVGMIINIRNILIVAVSADQRFGPIYNQGVAQQVYESLLENGYPAQGGIPLTLIGYSGGGQIAVGIVPFLKRALGAPIEVISLAGVIGGNGRVMEAEQLYHLVGSRDPVERLGPIMFPRRWAIAPLSYWNRAKRKGKISFISLGPVGHQVPGGVLDDQAFLPDGRSHLQQTLDLTLDIVAGDLRQYLDIQKIQVVNPGDYYRFQSAPFNHPSYYPVQQALPIPQYRPVGDWLGRLILPNASDRLQLEGIWFELLHTPPAYQHYLGQRVHLRWRCNPGLKKRFQAVTRDIHFSAEAEASHREGMILPTRLNHWRLVTPLESLAGAHPVDDIIVKLPEPVIAEAITIGKWNTLPPTPHALTLTIAHEPIQIAGLYYALVQFLSPVAGTSDRYHVVHYNPDTRRFNGLKETVRLPQVVPDGNGIEPSTSRDLERSPLNATGWYIHGAQAHDGEFGEFVVQALRPRQLFQLKPDRTIASTRRGRQHLHRESWENLEQKKGTTESVLIDPKTPSEQAAIAEWQEGDQALLVHVYGGIGGQNREPAARGPVYFGHFAYGIATVAREPLTQELQFDIHYHQVYTHNRRGLVAGTLDWSKYIGDRQWGFLGTRPVSDILIKLPAYTEPFDFNGTAWAALDDLRIELELMTARYRTGDGTGVTYVGPANNCAQDSNQAMYASAAHLEAAVIAHRATLKAWEADNPDQAQQFQELLDLRRHLQQKLLPFGSARADWADERESLGSNLSDFPLQTVGRGLLSWRTMLPRKASDTITQLCLSHGASLWILRTNQVGGYDPTIEPLAPITL